MAEQDQQSYDIQGILREMRDEYWRGIEEGDQAGTVETRDYVVFRLGGERFGIPTTYAKEVLRMPKVVRVPRVPSHIQGIINLRGQIVAVTDLRPLLGLSGSDALTRNQLVVVEAEGLLTALVTEGVEGIHSVTLSAIEPVTEGLAGFPREAAEGHVASEQGLLVLLNLEHILGRAEFTVDQKGLGESY